jgi:hypothetical protein
LIEEILVHSAEARYLVLATKREEFGTSIDDQLARLRAATNTASGFAAHLGGFVLRAFAVPEGLGNPVRDDIAHECAPTAGLERQVPWESRSAGFR